MRDVGTANGNFDGDVVTARIEPSESMRAYECISYISEQAHQWQEWFKLHISEAGEDSSGVCGLTRFSGTKHKKVLREPKVDGRGRATSVQGGVKDREVRIE